MEGNDEEQIDLPEQIMHRTDRRDDDARCISVGSLQHRHSEVEMLVVAARDNFVIGDKDAWVLEGTQNFAYLKPSKPGLETSMDLITAAGNIYTFYCVSVDAAQPDLKVFVEPTDEKLLNTVAGTPRLLPAAEVDQFREAAALEVKAAQEQSNRFRSDYAVHALKFDYKFKKNKKPFKLSAIYHDDRFTYIHSSATEKPTLYEVKDGQPTLINFALQDGVYVIDHIVDKGYLSVGKHKTTFERQGE